MLPKSFMRKCLLFSADQRGAVLVLVSLSLVALMGFAAFCLDVGVLYKARREMVTAADAAALAGAKELAISKGANVTEAISEAKKYATEKNGADETHTNAGVKNIGIDGRQVIEVTAGKNTEYTFAKVLGFKNKIVSAKAVATWGYPTEVKGGNVLPLFIDEDQYKLGDGNLHDEKLEYPGNWGLLDVGSGENAVNLAIQGYPLDLSKVFSVGEIVTGESKPGLGQSIIDAIEKDFSPPEKDGRMIRYDRNEVTMDGLIPIIKVSEEKSEGKLKLEILGFAVYRIKDVVVDNEGNGSKNADPALVGGTPPMNYQKPDGSGPYAKGTIIGKLISGEMIDVNVVLKEGDQDPSYDYGAAYVKLID